MFWRAPLWWTFHTVAHEVSSLGERGCLCFTASYTPGGGGGNLSHSYSIVGQWFASMWVTPLFRSSALHGWWCNCGGSLLLTFQSSKFPIHKPRQRKMAPSILSDIAPKLEAASHDWELWGRTNPCLSSALMWTLNLAMKSCE